MIIGVLFLLFGISMLLRIFFGWHVPVFRTFGAVFLIYLGLRMLFGGNWGFREGWRIKDSENVVFDKADFHFEKGARNRYSTVFGSSVVDLTHVPSDTEEAQVHIDTVFGETKVMVDPKIISVIRASAVFGEAKMPNGDMVAFGTLNYKTGAQSKTPPKLKIHANVVFGSIKFVSSNDVASGASEKDEDSDED